MSDKLRITEIKRARCDLRREEEAILDKHLGEDEGQWHKVGTWKCEDSPIGVCVYKPVTDRALDDCVFCHHPNERL